MNKWLKTGWVKKLGKSEYYQILGYREREGTTIFLVGTFEYNLEMMDVHFEPCKSRVGL